MTSQFKCSADDYEQIHSQFINKYNLEFPAVHKESLEMIRLALAFKEQRNENFVRIPFCVTTEAEALGADIKLGNHLNGPRVNEYALKTLEAVKSLKPIDLNEKRVACVLESISKLSEFENVILTVAGPFTIISSLIDSTQFYRWIRKEPEVIESLFEVIEDSVVDYIEKGIHAGAQVISYGDPVGAIDIVGPKIYESLSGKSTYRILKRIEALEKTALVHLCGKTSNALESVELSQTKACDGFKMTYGDAILKISKEKRMKFIGNKCIKTAPKMIESGRIYEVILK